MYFMTNLWFSVYNSLCLSICYSRSHSWTRWKKGVWDCSTNKITCSTKKRLKCEFSSTHLKMSCLHIWIKLNQIVFIPCSQDLTQWNTLWHWVVETLKCTSRKMSKPVSSVTSLSSFLYIRLSSFRKVPHCQNRTFVCHFKTAVPALDISICPLIRNVLLIWEMCVGQQWPIDERL